MYRPHPIAFPWRPGSGTGGRRLALLVAAGWFGAWTVLFRVAALPVPVARPSPPSVSWRGGAGESSTAERLAVWTPAAFALSTPAGFSHFLRRGRAGTAPPVHAVRPEPAYLDDARTLVDLSAPGTFRPEAAKAPPVPYPYPGVFPPRESPLRTSRLVFPDGWESRLFSGIDLNFGNWTGAAWRAQVEMRFDAKGIPISAILAQSSGLPEVDRRLARSANGWRLLEPSAPRVGTVGWQSPAAGSAPSGPGEAGP